MSMKQRLTSLERLLPGGEPEPPMWVVYDAEQVPKWVEAIMQPFIQAAGAVVAEYSRDGEGRCYVSIEGQGFHVTPDGAEPLAGLPHGHLGALWRRRHGNQ